MMESDDLSPEFARPVRRSNIRMQYGLSDTPLTNALEGGDFDAAEKIILSNTDAEYLDEGPFDRIPLGIVLNNDPMYRLFPRNLRLARLLVERGADPNLRIPLAQLQRSSPSPLEYLVKFCEDALDLCDMNESADKMDSSGESEYFLEVIGLHNEVNLSGPELKVQLLELLDVFLAHGGDPNVISTSAHSTVFHTVLRNPEPCMDLVLKLCEAGGDLNRCNAHRTTPLMDLVTYAELDTSLDILNSILEVNPDISSLSKQNCCDHTALWRAMLSGSPRVAMELLKKGADPSPRALVSQGGWYRGGKYIRTLTAGLPWAVSAIFAPLLGNSAPYIHFGCVTNSPREFIPEDLYEFNIDLFNKVLSYALCPIIDDSEVVFFECSPELLLELERLLESQTYFTLAQLESPMRKIEDISVLLFGKLKAGLQQMCIQRILRCILENSDTFLQVVQEVKNRVKYQEDTDNKGNTDHEKKISNHWMLVQELTPAVLDCLVLEHLNLPSVLVNSFMIEAARLQLGACLFTLETVDCFQACDGESDEGSIDPSLESNIDDGEVDDDDDDDEKSSWLSESSQYEMDSVSFEGYVSKLEMELCTSSNSSDETTGSEEDLENVDLYVNKDHSSDKEEQVPSSRENDCCIVKKVPSPENSESSGESIPHSICRDDYEQFSNEFCNSDISPGNITSVDDYVHSE
ncbi:uncharacterized protein [Anabrus simplex]|uniref:uncharacterized protein n=1 Tax=Anabrus simplex TaxID=316456 RepID=UPI0035A2C880